MWPNLRKISDLVTFTENSLNGKLLFCAVILRESKNNSCETYRFLNIAFLVVLQKLSADVCGIVTPTDNRTFKFWNLYKTFLHDLFFSASFQNPWRNLNVSKHSHSVVSFITILLVFSANIQIPRHRFKWKPYIIRLEKNWFKKFPVKMSRPKKYKVWNCTNTFSLGYPELTGADFVFYSFVCVLILKSNNNWIWKIVYFPLRNTGRHDDTLYCLILEWFWK